MRVLASMLVTILMLSTASLASFYGSSESKPCVTYAVRNADGSYSSLNCEQQDDCGAGYECKNASVTVQGKERFFCRCEKDGASPFELPCNGWVSDDDVGGCAEVNVCTQPEECDENQFTQGEPPQVVCECK